MLCVFGILKTEYGLKIKEEMLEWLSPLYDVLQIEQEPPGVLFEYPAIQYTMKLSIETNEPVLYIHTKGAGHPNGWYNKGVLKVWKMEFGEKQRAEEIFNFINHQKSPTVVCPFTGKSKATWFNAFVVNPSAAKIILDNLKTPNECKDRYYYEVDKCNFPEINVIGSICDKCDTTDLSPIANKLLRS